MKHFSTEEWIDFVNQVMNKTQQTEMQQHLDAGCKSCAQTVSTWRQVRVLAGAEARYQPPEGVVRIAKAAFAAQDLKRKPGAVELLFDTLTQPLLAGSRAATADARQMLYGVGPFLLHLQISVKPERGRIAVAGQLLNSKQPDEALSDVSIIVSNRLGDSVQAKTNQYGEFLGEVNGADELELQLPVPQGKDILISLRGMSRLTGDSR